MTILRVEEWFCGNEFKTDVLASTDWFLKDLVRLAKKKSELVMRFRALVKRCAERGFGDSPLIVRHEFDGIYAIGNRHGPLTRAGGFYAEGEKKETFVVILLYEKSGQGMQGNETEQLKKIAKIRDDGSWERMDE